MRTRMAMFCALILFSSVAFLRAEDFEAKTFTGANGKSLPYRIMKPLNLDPAKKYPLVLFFHGVGENGADNNAQLKNGVMAFASKANREKFPCFVACPQCPQGVKWVDTDWGLPKHTQPKEPTWPLVTAMELLASLEKELPIDTTRIYISGVSLGGFGTWDAITRWPEKFSAAVPVCGGADETKAPMVAKLPIWTFHGDKDGVVKTIRSRNMVKAIQDAGGSPKYTEFPGVGHDSWNKAYIEPGLMEWLFAQKGATK